MFSEIIFHITAVELSDERFPYILGMLMLYTSAVVESCLNGLVG